MNLIGNCCISSFLLRKYGYGNTNPFTWSIVDFTSFCNLLTNYDNIDWYDIDISRRAHPCFKGKDLFELHINDMVTIQYIHFLFDKNALSPTVHKNGKDVFYCKIWEYIVDKYNERVSKMLNANSEPIFVIEWEAFGYTKDKIEYLLQIPLGYKVIILTNDIEFSKVKKENLYMIYDVHKKNDWFGRHPGGFPGNFADRNFKEIYGVIHASSK